MISIMRYLLIATLLIIVGCSSMPASDANLYGPVPALAKRDFDPMINGKWIGNGISYGAYRDGEGPGKGLTSKVNILEDLQTIARRWNLIRLYGSDPQSENILKVIEENDLPIRVMLGAWLDACPVWYRLVTHELGIHPPETQHDYQ